MTELGSRIRLLRTMLGVSATELASRLGVAKSHISQLEHGKALPSLFLVVQIAKMFAVNEHWLLTGEGPMFVRRVEIADQVEAADDLAVTVVNQETGETHQIRAGPERPVVALPDHHLADLVKDLAAWWQQASEDERAWLRVHLRREIPGFGRKPRPKKSEKA